MVEQSSQHEGADLSGLRIVLVGPLPPPYGGMANQTRQLASLLAKEGINVEVIRNNDPYSPHWVANVRGLRAVFRLVRFMGALWSAIGRADLVHVMANSGWAWHLFTVPPVWIAWLRQKPSLINYRGGGAERFFSSSWWIVALTVRRAKIVTVPSGYLREVFSSRDVNTAIVPNIINLSRFVPNGRWRNMRKRRIGKWPHIVIARNLEPIYDIGTGLRAFSRIVKTFPNSFLTIAGLGPARAELESLAKKLSVEKKVRFAGRLSNEEVAVLYEEVDLMLNPSLVDNMPISILEGLASGVPVVSTFAGGIPYIVRSGETAMLVEPGDDAAMADAALSILGDAKLANKLISKGLNAVEQYEWPAIKRRLFNVYAACAGRS